MAFIRVCWRISTVRLTAKAWNPPLQSGIVPWNWHVTSVALTSTRKSWEGSSKAIIRSFQCWELSTAETDLHLWYVVGVCNEERRHWAHWNAILMRKSQHVFWKERSCPIHLLKCCENDGWRRSRGHFICIYGYICIYTFGFVKVFDKVLHQGFLKELSCQKAGKHVFFALKAGWRVRSKVWSLMNQQ